MAFFMLLGAGVFFLMTTFFTEVHQTLVPRDEVKHGPLPPLLVAMTLVTGLDDAFSYLVLGHVFVANMTGNVVFLAFALAGAPGFSILASLVALGSFVLGSFGGGLLGSRLTFSHTILFKDQKKSREKVEQLNGRLRARFGCRAIRATAFSSPVARPLCVPNSRQSGQWSANTAARSTGKQALLLGRPPLARPQ